jgi:hypothetical protein
MCSLASVNSRGKDGEQVAQRRSLIVVAAHYTLSLKFAQIALT